MMCFQDREFCTAACANHGCTIKYTPDVARRAKVWWGKEGAPIALGDQSSGCADYIPESKSVMKRINVQKGK